MYFTENKELQRFEREMKIVPNFERKEVWEYADSCNECKNYKCKLEGCMEAHCPYLMRKIRSNSIITRDLVETFLLSDFRRLLFCYSQFFLIGNPANAKPSDVYISGVVLANTSSRRIL